MKTKLAVLLALFAIIGVADANLLTNGDFNTPLGAEWTIWSDDAIGWVNQEVITPALALEGVYDGTQQMSLGAAGAGPRGMFQTVAGVEGEEYTLNLQAGAQDWWLPNGSAYLKFLDAADAELASFEIDTTASIHNPDLYDTGVAYQDFSITETAPVGTTQVKVELAEWAGTGTVWFDNVEVIPEPATFGLVGLFGGGLMLFRRRFRN